MSKSFNLLTFVILEILLNVITFDSCKSKPQLIENTVRKLPVDTTNYSSIIEHYKMSLGQDFTYEGYSYFVVISNLEFEETKKIENKTIGPAVKCFYNDYFGKKPEDLTTIFLFKDDKTYHYWAKELFDDDDLSRFGYYKPNSKVMLMNISTGTGTLVHELTHALVRYDFPDIPAWFNEGLGSLYERSSLENGVILGYVNWRLPALQDAIKNHTYSELSELVKCDDDSFYGKKSELNYSQARYFCMYMQQMGVLRKFYRAFRDNFENDKTGKTEIEKIFNKIMVEIDYDFVTWVKTLKYEN